MDNFIFRMSEDATKIVIMYEEETRICWDATDIKMSIRRYFYALDRNETDSAHLEIDFMRSIHREWSYNPLMRRTGPEAMAIIDDFLKWCDSTPADLHSIEDFTVRRLVN